MVRRACGWSSWRLALAVVAIYNYLGFRLEGPAFGLPVIAASLIFAAYGAGTVSSRLVGRWVPRFGRRRVLTAGTLAMITGALLTLGDRLALVIIGLLILTAGAFVVHAVASAWVGHHARVGRAQATALYNVSLYTVRPSSAGWPASVGSPSAGRPPWRWSSAWRRSRW